MNRRSLGRGIAATLAVSTCSLTMAQNSDMKGGGGAHVAGMAGAGLALPFDVDQRGRLNPALFAFGTPRFRPTMPSLGIHVKGLSISKLKDNLTSVNSGGVDGNELGNFAQDFASKNTELGLSGDLGISVSKFNLAVVGEVVMNAVPNAALKTWAKSGADLDNVPEDALMDGYGYGFYSVEASFGARSSGASDDKPGVAWGIRMKRVTAYYAHHIASKDNIENGGDGGSSGADEMGTSDVLSKQGTGFDFGLQITTGAEKNTFFGLVIRNLIEPKITFSRTAPDMGATSSYRPFRRQIDLGFGYRTSSNTTIALDFTDATNTGKSRAFRLGVEQAIGKSFALRAGIAQHSGLCLGVSLLPGSLIGIDIAVGKELPMTLLTSMRF